MGIFSIKNLEVYRQQVKSVDQRMKVLGYGSQSECARDLEEQPIAISRLLRGIVVDENLLQNVNAWAIQQEEIQAINLEHGLRIVNVA